MSVVKMHELRPSVATGRIDCGPLKSRYVVAAERDPVAVVFGPLQGHLVNVWWLKSICMLESKFGVAGGKWGDTTEKIDKFMKK